ncbi:leucine-rich repeat domain-containing protein [Gimesia algae]|uniref:Leucine Rich repeats (2 copies) n=1 Tax=Gimesia algae TaxID=2527971 RepID=A0A517VIX1_9PLAN|nr:hypothetical protein [Gimesia algae]QDT92958.1 Leucine Rich repeats (2 copies) [Gimesia algae]
MQFSRIGKWLLIPVLTAYVLWLIMYSEKQKIEFAKQRLRSQGLYIQEIYRFHPIRESTFKLEYVFDTEALSISQINSSDSRRASEFIEDLKKLAPSIRSVDIEGAVFTDQDVIALGQMPKLGYVSLNGSELTDSGIEALSKIKELGTLAIYDLQLPDSKVIWLQNCTELWKLTLHNCELSPETYQQLAALEQLEKLNLLNSNIRSSDLQSLANLSSLDELILEGTRVDDQAGPYLNRLKTLQRLDLGRTKVGAEVCKQLSKINLKELILRKTPVDDRAAPYLKNMKAIQRLNLSRTNVGDEVCLQVAKIDSLISLNLNQTPITDSGVQALLQGCLNVKGLYLDRCQISSNAFSASKQWPANLIGLTLKGTNLSGPEFLQIYRDHDSLIWTSFDWEDDTDLTYQKYLKMERSRILSVRKNEKENS